MAADAALVAVLTVRLDKFEAQMKRAGLLADRGVKDVEDKFARANPQLGARIAGNFLGGALAGAVTQAIGLIETLGEKFIELEKSARLAGVSMNELFAIQRALGGDASNTARAFESVATLLDRAKRGDDNSLGKLLAVNDQDVKGIKDASDAWTRIVDIIFRAKNEIQAREMGAELGISADVVDRIRKAGGEFETLKAKAGAAAPDLEKLNAIAKDFEKLWKDALDAVKNYFLENIGAMRESIAAFIETTVRELRAIASIGQSVRSFFGMDVSGGKLTALADNLEGVAQRFRDTPATAAQAAAKLGAPVRAEPAGGFSKPTPFEDDEKKARLNALEREERRAKERTAQMELEGRLIGANVETRSRELEVLRLTQMAEREKIPLTDAVRMKIDEQAEAYGRAAGKLDEQLQKHQQLVSLQNFAGNTLVDVLDRATQKGAKLADIMLDVTASIKRAALQALVLGQGPLAGLFGTTSGVSGQPGGFIGLLGGLLKASPGAVDASIKVGARAMGGPVSPNVPYLVGEHGPELLVPRTAGTVMPNGGGGTIIHVDARGAQAGVAEQIVSALKAYDAQANRTLPGRLRSADMRFA